jgi:two-component system, chemotaxis family, sensor kinase CheA
MTDHSLLDDFIVESGEHLEETERNLLRLEQQPNDAVVLNEIFRSIHTIKGSSEYLGLERIAELTHKLESFLDLLRRGERVLDSQGIDLLIGANDRISQLVDDLARHHSERAPIEDMVARIDSFTGKAEPISAEAAIGEASESDCEAFTDEYDEELFGIFVSQLADGLGDLSKETLNLRSAPASEVAKVLARYEDRLNTLQSSANYMGYDKLKQVYVQWSGTVAGAMERLSMGQDVDWDLFAKEVTAHYIGRIKGLFPKVAALQTLEQEMAAPVEVDLPPAPPLDAPEDAKSLSFSDIDFSIAAPVSVEPATPGNELELFSEATDLDGATKADRSLFDDFIVESGEQLEETERNLLRLEQQPDDPAVLNEIFRSIHTIKGSSDYLGLERIAELTHKLESFLDMLRRGEGVVDSQGIDLLIGAHDRICQLVDDVARHGSERTSIDDMVARISGCTLKAEPISDAEPTGEAASPGDCETLDEEYDEELFGIFASQLNEGLEALWEQTRRLLSDAAPRALLDQYADQLNTLRSSANYMGYDKLKQVYTQWVVAVNQADERLSAGQTIDWDAFSRDVTIHFIRRVQAVFPNVAALQSLKHIVPVQEDMPAPQTTGLPAQTDVQQQLDLSEQLDLPEQMDFPEQLDALAHPADVEQDPAIATVDAELQQDFILEAREQLEEVERNLLHLTQVPNDSELLNELFRSMHTIKGSSEYLGLARTAVLSHKLENLLDLLRCGQCTLSSAIMDLLLVCSDRLGTLVKDLETHQEERTGIDDLVADIDAAVDVPEQGGVARQASEPEASLLAPEAAVLESTPAQSPFTEEPIHIEAAWAPEPEMLEPEPVDADQAPATPASEIVTVYQEAYDSKLYAIFLSQFNEGLSQLDRQIGQLETQMSIADVTQCCRQWLTRLRFSANYMEYDALKAVYDRWIQAADKLCEQLPTLDKDVWIPMYRQMMLAHMDMVRRYFNFADLAAALPAQEPEPAVPQRDAPDGATALDDEDLRVDDADLCVDDAGLCVDDAGPRPSAIEASAIEAVAPERQDAAVDSNASALLEEQGLLSRLEMAFDERLGTDEDGDAASHEQMAESLFSSDQARDEPPADFSKARTGVGGQAPPDAGIESLLLSALSGERIPRQPVMATPLSSIPERLELADGAALMEDDDQRTHYALGRRRGDKFHERMIKQSIRVDAAKIDVLMNQVGELVVNRAGFNQLFSDMRDFQLLLKQTKKFNTQEMKIIKDLTNRINEATVSLGRVTSELQENVMKVRMLPIAQLFSRYPRVVHDLVRNSEKRVELVIRGEETELDRMVIEQIADPLVHIIRNAVDHGIEALAERQRKGKPESGTLRLEAYHEGNYVVIEVSDDGRGIDSDLIKARALEKGFFTSEELDNMAEDQIRAIIMRPGFSTVDEVTHTSGRGVGMDVVKDNIDRLNGTIEIISTIDRGTLFRIRIPLTLAIIQALKVGVAGETFIIPLSAVDETLRIHRNEISVIEGMEICYLRETTLPLIRLSEIFKMQEARQDNQEFFVVVVNTGSRQVGLIVDQLQGRQEVVIKPLEDYLQVKSGFSGATILGDGSISLILDIADLVYLAIALHTRKMRAVSA